MTAALGAAEVHAFWLETVGPSGWFRRDAAVDAEIARRFGPVLGQAGAGAFAGWEATPEGALALVVLLDQFPRNIHRGAAEAFAFDAAARAVADRAIAAGHDRATPAPERMFFYLPFEHSEALADQDRAVALFTERLPDADLLRHAELHRDLIRRFGRFPHRNAALGRLDTPEERAHLDGGGYAPGAKPG